MPNNINTPADATKASHELPNTPAAEGTAGANGADEAKEAQPGQPANPEAATATGEPDDPAAMETGEPSGAPNPAGAEARPMPNGASHPNAKSAAAAKPATPTDPFDPAALRIDSTSDASLGVERPILVVPVKKPDKQTFFRVHPDPAMRVDVRVIELEAERETYLVTPAIAAILPGETRPVRLLTCIPRVGGGVFLWPLKLPTDDRRGNSWTTSAHKAAEIAEKKWVRMQSNQSLQAYDVQTSSHIPDPVWPVITMQELLRIAFSDGRLIDREDHPVIRQLLGYA